MPHSRMLSCRHKPQMSLNATAQEVTVNSGYCKLGVTSRFCLEKHLMYRLEIRPRPVSKLTPTPPQEPEALNGPLRQSGQAGQFPK